MGGAATRTIEPPTFDEIRAARERLFPLRPRETRGARGPLPVAASSIVDSGAIRTPLVRLNAEGAPAEIWLKLENLQPIGSFKLRGAGNAMMTAPREKLAKGVYTASAGNMAQGVAWNARRLGVPCTVVVPESAPQTKLAAIERLGGKAVRLPYARWWQVLEEHGYPGIEGFFIHPVSDSAVMAGNGTIGLEILEDLPDVDAVVVPFGGGGLSCGIAAALSALRPQAKVYAAEVETAAPFAASLAAGGPVSIEHTPSFVDGIGGKSMLPEMWPVASALLAGSLVVSIRETASALKLLAERNRVIAEGAGATSVAAGLKFAGEPCGPPDPLAGKAGSGKVVAVVSGGNIDPAKLATILQGGIP